VGITRIKGGGEKVDSQKIGLFLKALRKEKHLTQEDLGEKLNVSSRTVSRWETGRNLPDLSLLVALAEFYDISITEIIDGERKSESMNEETKETALKMADYSHKEKSHLKMKVIGLAFIVFSLFTIISALMIFPSESSWGSIYSIFGGIVLIVGLVLYLKAIHVTRKPRMIAALVLAACLFVVFNVSDYMAVTQFNQAPRFAYEKTWNASHSDEVIYKTLFFKAVETHRGTTHQKVEIVK
jgi:transcriptional regulator with XRE-family HTH domain